MPIFNLEITSAVVGLAFEWEKNIEKDFWQIWSLVQVQFLAFIFAYLLFFRWATFPFV